MKRIAAIVLAIVLALGAGVVAADGKAARGQSKSEACKSCHEADGNSRNPQFPRLAGQYESYLMHALQEYKSGERKNPIMNGMAGGLSEQDMADLAAYFAGQTGDLRAR